MSLEINPYRIQKLALIPIVDSHSSTDLQNALRGLPANLIDELYHCIWQNRLGPAWIEQAGSEVIKNIWDTQRAQKLSDHYRQYAFLYFQQLIATKKLTKLFDRHSISNAVFKGAHTREVVYDRPVSRYCCDVDVLIGEEDKKRAMTLLANDGYTIHENKENLTHEVSLLKDKVCIDLHWHIMRSGRVPYDLTPTLLANRRLQKDYWALSTEDNLFILLIHQIFTKYPTITRGGLIRMIDLAYWLKKTKIDWQSLLDTLRSSGVCTAAWISCEYLEILAGIRFPQEFKDEIAPSPPKRWYLRQWITRDLPSKFPNHPLIPKVFFTLPAHDSIKGAAAFYSTMRKSQAAVK